MEEEERGYGYQFKRAVEKLLENFVGRDRGTSWTPTVSQGVGVTVSASSAWYWKTLGRVEVEVSLTVSSSGTAGQGIGIGGFPASLAPAYTTNLPVVGSGKVRLASDVPYIGAAVLYDASTIGLQTNAATTDNLLGTDPNIQLTNGARITLKASWRV